MQEVGTTTWWMVNQNRVSILLTNDIQMAALKFGFFVRIQRPHDPNVIFARVTDANDVQTDIALLFVPPPFLSRAVTNPIETVATVAWIGSQIRDLANDRLTVDPRYIGPRSLATEAHFLLHAIKDNPDVHLSHYSQQLIQQYPQGINNLPISMRYRGPSTSAGFKSVINN